MVKFESIKGQKLFDIIDDGRKIGLLQCDEVGGSIGFMALIDGKVGYFTRDLMKAVESARGENAEYANEDTLRSFELEMPKLTIGMVVAAIDSQTSVELTGKIEEIYCDTLSGFAPNIKLFLEDIDEVKN